MPIIKQDTQLEATRFTFDDLGNVNGIYITVNQALYDDVAQERLTRMVRTVNIWPTLTATQRTQANTLGQRLKTLAEAL